MPAYGFDTTLGWIPPTVDDLGQTYRDEWFAVTGQVIDPSIESPESDYGRTVARILKAAWDDAGGVYGANFVGSASGAGLRNLLYPFIGPPQPDTASTVVLPLAGVAATLVPAGSAVRLDTDGPGAPTWVLQANVVIPGNGTFAYSEFGAKTAAAASTWSIATPVVGWATAGPNVADAVKGRLAETDLQYKQRFAQAVEGQLIGAAVTAVPGVTLVKLFENPTDIPDSYWGATHWLEPLVQGGDSVAIATALQRSRTYTVNLLGSTTETIPDNYTPTGDIDISYSEPNNVDVWVELTITKGEGYSSDTSPAAITARENAIKSQIVTWSLTRAVGLNVSSFQIAAQAVLTPSVPGISDITGFVGTVPGPVTTSVVAEVRDLLVFDASRITLFGV